jgi:cardiolipin synthase
LIWLVAVLLLFIFQMMTILLYEFRKPSKTVAWLFILFVFPIVGFIMYYFLAKEYSRKKKVRQQERQYAAYQENSGVRLAEVPAAKIREPQLQLDAPPTKQRLYELLHHIADSSLTDNNAVSVLTDAEAAYSAMLEAMERAELYIHFEIYTFRNDHIGRTFQELLIRKAKQGVKVRCIFDGIGSYQLDHAFLDQFRQGGVEIYIFLPPLIAFFDKRMNYRNHRRITVIDGYKGYLGGLNVGAEYLGGNPKLGFWRDTHLELVGDAVHTLQSIFLKDWMFVSGRPLQDKKDGKDRWYPPITKKGNQRVQIISSGPDTKQDKILQMYFGAINCAQHRIYITTPYFIPDPSLRMALKTAAVSGLDVRIIYPLRSDSPAVNYASSSYFDELMEAGVRFYAYQKGFLHAKILIVDEVLASVGSANVDLRSFYSNFELNALIFEKETIRRLAADFAQDLQDSKELKLEAFRQRSRWHKTIEIAARLLSPLF